MNASGDWNVHSDETPRLCVINSSSDGCWTALSALFVYLMSLIKLILIIGSTDESYHLQMSIGKQLVDGAYMYYL